MEYRDLGGGFKYFLFSPLFGEDSHFDSYFSTGLKPPTRDILTQIRRKFQPHSLKVRPPNFHTLPIFVRLPVWEVKEKLREMGGHPRSLLGSIPIDVCYHL